MGAVLIVAALSILRLFFPTTVQASARIACTLPSEHETLLLYVNVRPGGAIDVECGPLVGGAGAYRRSSK